MDLSGRKRIGEHFQRRPSTELQDRNGLDNGTVQTRCEQWIWARAGSEKGASWFVAATLRRKLLDWWRVGVGSLGALRVRRSEGPKSNLTGVPRLRNADDLGSEDYLTGRSLAEW
jgi:hypothetical protein